jgi:hypothetical protein
MTCNNTFECHPGGYTCKENGAHFGNQTGTTCVNRPAQRFFNYTCDADEYVDLYKDIDHFSAVDNDVPDYVYKVVEIDNMFGVTGWKTFLNKKTYKDDQLVCVFQPRVQVMDNWGWCTGSCNDENKGGCYNEFGLTKAVHCLEASMNAWVGYSNVVVVAL